MPRRRTSPEEEVVVRIALSGSRKKVVIYVKGQAKYSYPSDDVEAWAMRIAVCLDVDNLEEVFWMLRSLHRWGKED